MPPKRLRNPSKASRKAFSISFATIRVRIATPINTNAKESIGNNRSPMLVLLPSQMATVAESFKAAASPIKMARKEKMATTNPLLYPLKTANAKMII